MKLSSDVNTIFAYGNSNDLFHNKVWLFMAKNKRNDYVLLARVKHVFIYTYKDYLTTCCAIIEIAIREEKTKRSKSPSETYKPSTLALSANIHQQIEKFIKEKSEEITFNIGGVKNFINLLLTEYSIPELFENNGVFGEFREKYNVEAEKRAEEILNKFLHFFHSFYVMNIEQYDTYEEWIQKIKESKYKIFDNKKDYEDILLAAEILSCNQDIGTMGFFTCDKEIHRSIIVVAKEY